MASKRKSTTPCMIPSKTKHGREDIVLGCLPELLPTIPEDSILSISGEPSSHAHSSHDAPGVDGADGWHKGGTYSCLPCCFESRDLNSFLDHLNTGHADFRAQPSFYCLNCGVSVVQFEALALHNAQAHPELQGGAVHGSLHVKTRDGITAVEQSLFTENGEDLRDPGISLTKTPMMKMMKAKGDHKKIVVSHTVEVRRIDADAKEATAATDPNNSFTNVPELQNGTAPPAPGAPTSMPKTSVSHVITTVPSQPFHQLTPSLYTSPAADSSGSLPKVMIPLSSIPTYNSTMDTSSFLKTSFGKFPYPTKAELCYLTVVSGFPEEQIKLWFTAQRLKQGISWSPEEIEEAKRKMFNTVFQAAAPQKQPSKQQHANHNVMHHTIPAQPAPAVPSLPNPKIHPGSMIGRQTRVIASQANMPAGQQITRVSYTTSTSNPIPPKIPSIPPPTVVRTTAQVPIKTAGPPVLDAAKNASMGLDIAGGSSCVVSTSNRSSSSSSCSSNSSISSYVSSSSNGGDNGGKKSMNNGSPSYSVVSCSTVVGSSDNCSSDNETQQNSQVKKESKQSGKMNSILSILEGFSSNKSKVIINNSKSNIPDQLTQIDDGKNSNCVLPMTSQGSGSGDYSSTCNNDSVHSLNHASNAQNDNTSTPVITKSSNGSSTMEDGGKYMREFPVVKGMSILQQLIKEEDQSETEKTALGLKVDPIKINLKRLQVNKPYAMMPGSESTTLLGLKTDLSETPGSQMPPFFAPWDKKTPQQVHVLRQAFSSSSWPSSQQYEELSVLTGLPKPEVVRWFSDSRYIHKNGQLQWLESYQHPPTGAPESYQHPPAGATESYQHPPAVAPEAVKDADPDTLKAAEQDLNKKLEGGPAAQLPTIQRGVWNDAYTPLLGLAGSEKTMLGLAGSEKTAEHTPPPQEHWTEGEEEHQQPADKTDFVELQTDGGQARDRLRTELLEV